MMKFGTLVWGRKSEGFSVVGGTTRECHCALMSFRDWRSPPMIDSGKGGPGQPFSYYGGLLRRAGSGASERPAEDS